VLRVPRKRNRNPVRHGIRVWISVGRYSDFVVIHDQKIVDAGSMLGWTIGSNWRRTLARLIRFPDYGGVRIVDRV